jgi:Domain of unknown function (DUF4157)
MGKFSSQINKPKLSPPANSPVARISFLQRTVGNSEVERLLRSRVSQAELAVGPSVVEEQRFGLQAKLAVNEPGDIYEEEADRIAWHVLAAPTHSAAPQIQRVAEQPVGEAAPAPGSVEHALASAGQPLEPALCREMEQHFGWEFSRVRVHTGAAAERSAREVNARAYTVGENLVFGAGEYKPGTRQGRRLLAHELTHVVQQSGAAANVVRRSNGFEDEPTREWPRAGTVVDPSPPGSPRGHVERGGEIHPGNVASGEINTGTPRGPTSGGGGGTASKLEAEAAKAEERAASAIRSVSELGKVGALDAALLYLQLHAAHFEALENVSKRVEIANDLLSHVEEFEKGARALRGAVNELQRAEAALPGEPLEAGGETSSFVVSTRELEYIEAYAASAGNIVSKAFDARVKLIKIIEGWDTVVAQSNATRDFTRKAVVEAAQILDFRFSKETGGTFRGFLIAARDDAGRVEAWARSKWNYGKDILDTANMPLRRAIDNVVAIRNELLTIAKRERPSAGLLVAIDSLKTAQDSNDATVALDAVTNSLSVLKGLSGLGNVRLRLALLKGKLQALSGG